MDFFLRGVRGIAAWVAASASSSGAGESHVGGTCGGGGDIGELRSSTDACARCADMGKGVNGGGGVTRGGIDGSAAASRSPCPLRVYIEALIGVSVVDEASVKAPVVGGSAPVGGPALVGEFLKVGCSGAAAGAGCGSAAAADALSLIHI